MAVRFRIFSLLLPAVALLGAATAPSAPSDAAATDLLAKHRAFVGWQDGDGTLTSWHLTGTAEYKASRNQKSDDAQTPVTVTVSEMRRGPIYRDTISRGPLTRDEGFTGRVFWAANENGNVVTLYDEAAQSALSENTLFDEATTSLPASSRGPAKIGDAAVQIVRVQPPKPGFAIDLYVDPQSGAYRRAVIDPEGTSQRTIEIDGYLDALPGKKVIGSYHHAYGQPVKFVKIEANVRVSDDDLHPPHPRQSWDFTSTDSIPIQVVSHTRRFGEGGRAVELRATVNGHSGNFLIDSGAGGILLFNPFATVAALESLGNGGYRGVNGGFVRASFARVKDFGFGKNVLHDAIVQVSSNEGLPGVDGIVGYDFLANAIVDVDLAASKLTILNPATFAPTVEKGAYAFPVDLSTRTPVLPITVGSNVAARPTLDSGDDFFVILSDTLRQSGKLVALANQINAFGTQFDERVFFGGVDGGAAQSAPCSRFSQIKVGPYRYETPDVCFGSPEVFGEDGGLIGFDFLRHFNWTFDYPDGRLVLTPNGG